MGLPLFGVTPLKDAGAKHPAVRWKQYQELLPDEDKLRSWFAAWPDAGVAVVLGPVSDLFVIDVDGPEAHAALLERMGNEPRAPKALSGSREPYRYHLFFKCPITPTKAKQTPWHPKLEFRGKGGVVVLPPSLHKSGNQYAWAPGRSLDDLKPPEVPPSVLKALAPVRAKKVCATGSVSIADKLAEIDASPRTLEFLSGARKDGPHWNDRLFQAACDLCGRGIPLKQAEPLLLAGAMPLNSGEEEAARRTIQSAYEKERDPAAALRCVDRKSVRRSECGPD